MNRRPRILGVDLHVDFRMCRAEARQPGNKQLTGKERRQQNTQRVPAVAPCDLRKTSVQRLQQWLNFIQERVSGSCQLESTRLALKQPHPERVLQLLHLMADGRRGEEQLVRGELEAAMTRSNTERP